MPTEHRRIRFPPGELRTALRELRRRRPDLVPSGDVRPDGFVDTDEGLKLRLAPQGNGDGPAAVLKAEAVAAALILFCQNRDIPLPRRSDKRLEVEEEEVVLVLDL